jgi:hypothetical protein
MPNPIDLPLNVLTGALATVVIVMGIRGLVPHLMRPARRDAFNLAMAMVLILAQSAGRAGYWDLTRQMISPENWVWLRDALGGVEANAFWNLILLWGGLHLLKLLHLLVPVGERADYTMLSAWNYPVRLGSLIRRMRRRE